MREVGFGNLAIGTLGILSLFCPDFLLPAAIVGGLFYGLAGLGHLVRNERNVKEQVALVSDLLIFVLLAGFVASRLLVIPAQAGLRVTPALPKMTIAAVTGSPGQAGVMTNVLLDLIRVSTVAVGWARLVAAVVGVALISL